jgi:hypothetical protein
MSDMPPVSEEVVVYGDAPEGSSGGGTDTISIPRDFYTYYVPTGPVIVNPPFPDPGGGGDLGNPKDYADDAGDKATWIAVGFGIIAMVPGVGEVEIAIAGCLAIGFGLLGYQMGEWEGEPPQPNYQRPAGSTIRQRTLALPGPSRVKRALKRLLTAERNCAVFIDAIECALGAFLAADPEWTQQHNEAAREAHRQLGQSLLEVADVLRDQAGQLRPAPGGPRPDLAAELPALLGNVRPMLDLSPEDEASVTELLLPDASRGLPTDAEIKSAIESFRQGGRRLVGQEMFDTRFAWPIPDSVRRTSAARG